MAYSSQLLSFNLLVNLVCSPPVSFSFQEEKLPNLPVSSAFGISSALHDYSGMSFAGQSVPFTVTLVSQDGIFFRGRRLRERAMRCTLTVAFLVLFFQFPTCKCLPQIFFSSKLLFLCEKHGNNKVATSLRQHQLRQQPRR